MAFVNTWVNAENPVAYLTVHVGKQISAEKQIQVSSAKRCIRN